MEIGKFRSLPVEERAEMIEYIRETSAMKSYEDYLMDEELTKMRNNKNKGKK